MTLDQLLMLTTVIDLGNVQAASQKLNKTQPAISKGLKQLENQLQISILDRSEYRLKLTPQGKQIYSHAKRILAEADILHQVTNHMVQGNESELHIAFDGVFDMSILTPIFAQIQQIYPQTHIIMRQEFLSGAYDALFNNQTDIVFSPKIDELTNHHSIDSIFINSQNLVNVASPKFIKRHPNLVSVSQIKNEYLIIVQDSGKRTKDLEFGVLDGQRKWYVNNFVTKKQLIVDDLGWGKLPEYLIQTELQNGKLITITPDGNDNHIVINFHAIKNKVLGPVGTHLWQTLKNSFHTKKPIQI